MDCEFRNLCATAASFGTATAYFSKENMLVYTRKLGHLFHQHNAVWNVIFNNIKHWTVCQHFWCTWTKWNKQLTRPI